MLAFACVVASFVYAVHGVAPGAAATVQAVRRAVLLADASYCAPGPFAAGDWSCPPCRDLGGVSSVHVSTNESYGTLLLSAYDSVLGVGVLAFRGTDNDLNRRDVLDFVHETSWWAPGSVHRGMLVSYSSLQAAAFAAVRRLQAVHGRHFRDVVVTGHSFGGVQAAFATLDLAANFSSLTFHKLTFGEPRHGDETYASYLASVARPLNFVSQLRVTHRHDIVPRMCGSISNMTFPCPEWRHTPHELWEKEVGGILEMCSSAAGEDVRCIGSVPARLLNWDDHDLYLGRTMLCCDDLGSCSSGAPN
mmetsp:Transcript_39229/g.108023  ORF Transcript_39229/g.108023 Transcript_39229/m.108023 type:complete len:305 (+) Transcript_39229:89-1003(+)